MAAARLFFRHWRECGKRVSAFTYFLLSEFYLDSLYGLQAVPDHRNGMTRSCRCGGRLRIRRTFAFAGGKARQ
jgi:hypothetical protein